MFRTWIGHIFIEPKRLLQIQKCSIRALHKIQVLVNALESTPPLPSQLFLFFFFLYFVVFGGANRLYMNWTNVCMVLKMMEGGEDE